jgi:lipoyl(octanoyl) transferase
MRLWRHGSATLYKPLKLRNPTVAAAVIMPPPSQLQPNNSTLPCRESFQAFLSSQQQRRCYTTDNVVIVHSGLSLDGTSSSATESNEKMDYIRGWAWQTVLLQQRLLEKRQQTRAATTLPSLPHVILVLEHEPVYTLGRGATVEHLTCFASSQSNDIVGNTAAARQRLGRSYRHADAARLSVDSAVMEPFLAASLSGAQLSRNPTLHRPDTAPTAAVPWHLTEPIWNAVDAVCRTVQQRHATFPPVCTPPLIDSGDDDAAAGGVPVYRMERGGEVTFHGPGQLLIYPIFDLAQAPFQTCDLHWYLRSLEQAVINAVTELVESPQHRSAEQPAVVHRIDRDVDYTGVWINGTDKIAAIGVAASRWITTHGIALNMTTNLSYFDHGVIVPCGIHNSRHQGNDNLPSATATSRRGVTSLAALGVHTTVSHTVDTVLKHLSRVFAIDLIQGEPIH